MTAKTRGKNNPQGPIGSKSAHAIEDVLAESLSRMAYSIPNRAKENRKSRFWFTMEKPAEVSKKTMAPKKLEHIDSEIVDRLSNYKTTSPGIYQGNIEKVREFFLNEIAPRTISASGGTTQAAEVLRRMLDTDIDQSTAQRFANMVNRAATLRMAEFVVSYFGLDPKYLDSVVGLSSSQGTNQTATDLKFVLEHVDVTNKLLKTELKQLARKIEDVKTK